MRRVLFLFSTLALPALAEAQDAALGTIVDTRINRYCHPPDECVLRGALLWDSANVAPRYPEIMRSVGIQGEARAEFLVRPDGSVDPASVVIPRVTNQAFQQLVIHAIRTWKFRVAASERPGAAIPAAVTIVFALADRCPAGLTAPITSLDTTDRGARLIVMDCHGIDRLLGTRQ
jgi:TonB family protein